MSVGDQNHYRINEVVRRHFIETAKAGGFGEGLANDIIATMLNQLEEAIDRTAAAMPSGFPEQLLNCLFDGLRCRAKSLESG